MRLSRVPPSLRGLLSWLVIGAMLPLALLLAGIVAADYHTAGEHAARQVQETARATALAVERELRATIAGLEALALSPSLAGGDLDAFRREAATLAERHFPGASVALLEPDGRQLLNTFKPPGTPLPRRPDLEALERVVATGLPAVSDVFEATLQRKPIVPVDVPVKGEDGRVRAILSLAPPLETFAEIVRRQRPEAGWVVSVLDRKGTVVARTLDPDRFVGRPATPMLRGLMERRAEGTVGTTSLEGTPVLTGWSRPGPSGWGVAVGIPYAQLHAPHRRVLGATLALSALALVGALASARIVAGRIAGPVRALVDLAARGPDDAAIPVAGLGLREADAVAAALAAAVRERAAAEAGMRELQARGRAELERLVEERTRELQEAQTRLSQTQRMEAVGQLTAGVAHDFNNLLAVVLGNLDLLRKRLPAADARALRLLDNTVHGARRGAALTQRLLAFARKQDLKPEPVGVPDLVFGMADLLARSIGPQVKIETRFAVGLPRAMVDAHQLEMAVLNLAVNARDAMPEGGALAVEVDEVEVGAGDTLAPGAYVRLRVSDTGAGMDAATLARATEPFFTTKGVGRGTGLGLSMVHGLAHQSGGRLRLDSGPGRGTTAEILLPAVPASAPPAPARVESPPARAGGDGGPRGRGLTVLVVDDDALVRDSTAAMLDELGHAAVEAESARQALDILHAGRAFDAVVTDHSMPGMSGARLAAEIEAKWPGLPVVLASGYAELPEDALGAVAERLTKPFQPGDLASALARATGSGGTGNVVPLRGQDTGRTRAPA